MTKKPSASLDWQYKEMRTLVMENEFIRVVSLLDKGSDIVELVYKPLDVDVMWHSPLGHRSPSRGVSSYHTSDSSFMDLYGGGWQDLLPVIGHGPITHHGASFGLHGETGLLSWSVKSVDETSDEASAIINARGVRFPYEVKKRFTVRKGEAKLRIHETLTNTSREALEFFWLQHPAYGEPFLATGDKIDLPEGTEVHPLQEINPNGRLSGETTKWPKGKTRKGETVDLDVIPSRSTVAEETTFLRMKDAGWYSLMNPRMKLGVAMSWDLKVHPWLWFWQNYNQPGYPWFGDAWNIALEPSSSFPATVDRMMQEQSYLKLAGRESAESTICVSFHTRTRRIRSVDRDGNIE